MKEFSMNDLRALELTLSQIRDFPPNNGQYQRGYITISNDEYHRLMKIAFIIQAEIKVRTVDVLPEEGDEAIKPDLPWIKTETIKIEPW